MAEPRFLPFQTSIGTCAIMWKADSILRVLLPSPLQREHIDLEGIPACPPFIQHAIDAMTRHLSGEPQTLSLHPIDLSAGTSFSQSVWREAQRIPCGETRTYGEIARAMGNPGASRAVGRALGANPVPLLVPCHRIISSNGDSGGFSADGGRALKMRLLALEHTAGASTTPCAPER